MATVKESQNCLIDMKGIVKRFPGVLALDHVDFQLYPGEVHVLLGENGAGKSTLIKVLSGALQCDKGEIFIHGEAFRITSPQTSLKAGLRFIYQEVTLVQEIDIARNMFLGIEPVRLKCLGIVDQKSLYEWAREYLKSFHMDMDPRRIVEELSITQQKMVEIARALVTDAKALILDEPTDVLEDRSRNDLFEVIKRLKIEQNVGFIYISHRYQEVYELGDRVTILRDGKNLGTYGLDQISLDEMIEKMVGGQISRMYPELPPPSEEEALRVENLNRGHLLKDVSLCVRQGEILGVTSLMGAGKTELGRAIAGIVPVDGGRVLMQGNALKSDDPAGRIRDGIAYLTKDERLKV